MAMTDEAFRELNASLAKLAQESSLSQWDEDFLHDLGKRLQKWGLSTTITPRQWAQIERMKDKYL